MLGVLLLLCALFSVLTLEPQQLSGEAAAEALGRRLERDVPREAAVLVVARGGHDDQRFVASLTDRLDRAGFVSVEGVAGDPALVRAALEDLSRSPASERHVASLVGSAAVVRAIAAELPGLEETRTWTPPARRWPTFLLKANLLNVASQIAVIAILAIGMTLVILTAGIDLSVGSLIALSAVLTAWCVGRLGGSGASLPAVLLAGAVGIAACAGSGLISGLVVTRFRVPPFIATLAMMQVASGLAYLVARGRPIHELPAGFETLGRGADPVLGVPHAVWLMAALYALGHVLLTRTVFGRHVYAVGGNAEAARLAGVPVKRVLLTVYAACGALAGLGGVLMASQLKSGAPTYGLSYELHVIAAVVVGGTSLFGGEGRIAGTLVGALIMGVIQNGMNLTNVESYTQKVVLGLVILGAVLLEQVRSMASERRRARQSAAGG
jgi:ribose transport system permease protein